MIIWIVNPFDALPGERMRLGRYASLANILIARGHEVHWWSSSFEHATKRQRYKEKVDTSIVNIHLVPTKPYSSNISLARLRNHKEYADIFRKMATRGLLSGDLNYPDRIIVSVPPLLVMKSALDIRKRFGGKVIFDIQDAWPQTFYRLVPGGDVIGCCLFSPIYALVQGFYKQADAITGVAQSYIKLAKAALRNIPNHMTPIGISLSQFDSLMLPRESEGRPFTFVYLGSMSTNYDLTSILYAAKQLQTNGYNFQVALAGRGPHEDSLRSQSEKMGLQNIIIFTGFLDFDGVVKLLSKSDVALNCIYPSSYSYLPNKIGDYLSAGLPVINSIPGELENLLHKYGAGIQYQAGNVSSLTNAMNYYISNRAVVIKHGSQARKMAEDLFNRDSSYPKWVDFIERI